MTPVDGPAARLKETERSLRWLAAVIIFNVVLSTSFQTAMFLTNHQKPDIPLAMLFGSLLTALTTLGLNYLLRKRPAAGALRIILLALGGLTALAALWNWKQTAASTFALYLLVEIATTVGVAATWTYFQAPLEAAQIRWLLPRLGAWGSIGGLIAGTVVPIALKYLKMRSHWLIWISALAWLLASVLVRMDYAARAPAKRRSSLNQQSHLRQIFTVPLVRWMILGTAGIIWTGALVQYESNAAMKDAWPQETINSITSVLLAVASIGGFATQTLVTTPVLERWGVGLALAILPATIGACMCVYFYATVGVNWSADLSVWVIVVALFLDKTLRPALHRPAESCLVAALSPSIRPTLLLVLGGIMSPFIKAVGALMLFIAKSASINPSLLTGIAIILAVLVTMLSTRWGTIYAQTLRETLEEGSVEALGSTEAAENLVPMIDGPRLRVLLEAIDMGTPRSRELALDLLRTQRSNLVAKAMQTRLNNKFEPVRIAALRWLADEPDQTLEAHLKQRWLVPDLSDNERQAILDAAGALGAVLIGDDTARWLTVPNLPLRTAALAVLLRSSDVRHQKVARRALEAMLNSQANEEISAGLRLVHEHKVGEFLPAVLARLADTDLAVRREALSCLPAFEDERARRPLWAALTEPTMAHVAVRALTSCGESIVPNIIAQLDSPDIASVVRQHLLRALGLIPSQSGVQCLLDHVRHSDRNAQLEALKSLNRLRRVLNLPPLNAEVIQSFVLSELRWGLHMLRARELLKDRVRPNGLLYRELDAQIDAAQQRVAQTLALLSPKDTMVHIFKALRSPNSPHRDQARELLRTLFKPGPIVNASLKLLDETQMWQPEFFHPPLSISSGQTAESAVEWLKLTADPWVIAALKYAPACTSRTQTFPPIPELIERHLDAVLFLKDVGLFETLTNAQLIDVAGLAEKVDLPAGRTLFNQGDMPDYLYLIRKGKLRVVIGGNEVARFGPGECVGEMAVLASTQRTAGVDTLEPCQLLRWSERDFLGLLDAFPEIGRALLKSLVRRLAQTGKSRQAPRAATIIGMVWGKDGPQPSTTSNIPPTDGSGTTPEDKN